MEDALAQSNQEFIEPKSAKKPKIDSVENEVGKRAQLFTCVECPSEFNSKDLLADHIIQTHTKVKCKLCSKDYDILALKKHYSEDHFTNPLACDKCVRTFVTEDLLKKHQTEKHELFCVCGICKQGFQSMKELGEHFENHELQPNSLEKINGKSLKKKTVTTKKTTMSKSTPRKISKEFACGICDRAFENGENLECHVALAHFKNIKCDICDRVFPRAFDLKNHLGGGKNQRTIYKCELCTKLFKNSCGKTAHMKDCPENITNSAKSTNKQCRKKTQNVDESTVKPFGCGNCGDSFETDEELASHKLYSACYKFP